MTAEPNDTERLSQAGDTCWSRIGVYGDQSCPQVLQVVHCRNCPVFADAGQRLFAREASPEYVQHWTKRLANDREETRGETVPILVFRLGAEWLAMDVHELVEVVPPRRILRVPHRTNRLFLGLTNVRGELQICVSLAELLGVQPSANGPSEASTPSGARMIVAHREPYRWVFPVDQVDGVHRVASNALRHLPDTLERSPRHLSEALFTQGERRIGLLSGDRLFQALEGAVR